MPRPKQPIVYKEVSSATNGELTRIKTAINDFKYDLGVAPDTDTRDMCNRRNSGRIINNLYKFLLKRELLPKSMEKDFNYIVNQLRK